MRILLDECLPRQLKRELASDDVVTVREMGWGSQKNGQLLHSMMQGGVDVFVTIDQNLTYQQNLSKISAAGLAVVVLHARSNSVSDLRPLAPALCAALTAIHPGEITHINS